MLFSKQGHKVSAICKKNGIMYRKFKNFFMSASKKITGPLEMKKLFDLTTVT
jgi:hypothetical protein